MLGIIRPPRRPQHWIAPGPPPSPDAEGRDDLLPRAGEDLCYLSGNWRILQRIDGHRWSLDDLVTAWVAVDEARHAPPRRFADLGCGIGSVLMMIAWRFPAAHGVGVEAQDLSADLARRSLEWNGIAGRCEVRLGDLRDPSTVPELHTFDLVTATPPYLALGTANESKRPQLAPCRFEQRGGIEAYCRAAARLLAPGGIFVTCVGSSQLVTIDDTAALTGFQIRRRLDVVPRTGKAPLFSVYTMCAGARQPTPRTDVLVVRSANGERTDRFRALRKDMGIPP